MRLDDIPLEMLNSITCAVDSRTDLLSFALACRSLYSAIAPSQLQYHDIRAPLRMPALWKRLAHPDDLHASMVRSLTILYNNRAFAGLDSLVGDAAGEERLPQEYSGLGESPTGKPAREIDLLREWEGDLILALKRMTNLHRFRWYRRTPVIQGENDIWTTLRILGTVRDVQFVDLQCRSGRAELNTPPIIVSPSFLSLRGLSSLDIRREETTSTSTTVDVALLLKVLTQNCYDMKSLHLHFNLSINSHGASIDFLIQNVDWPNLRDLYLHGFTCQTSLLSSFLDRHRSIEHLTLSRMTLDSGWRYLTLSDGALPSLHALDCQSPVAAAILKNPKVAVNLQSLQGIDFRRAVYLAHYTSWDDGVEGDGGDLGEGEQVESPWIAQLADALRTRPSITSLGIDCRSVETPVELARLAPHLTELSFDGLFLTSDSEWMHTVSALYNLERISWNWILYLGDVERKERVDPVRIRMMVGFCPKLRVIEDPRCGLKAVFVERGKEAEVKWVVRGLKESSEANVFIWDGEVYTA